MTMGPMRVPDVDPPFSGRERADRIREALRVAHGKVAYPRDALLMLPAGSVVLIPDEAEEIRRFIDAVLSSTMPDWDDVEAGESKVLRLLGGDQ